MTTPAQGFCTVISRPNPLARSGAGTSTARFSVGGSIALVWADGATDTYTPGANGTCLSIYDSATSVNGHDEVWIVLASHGTPNLWLAKEQDWETFGTLVGALSTPGEWARLWRLDGDQITKLDQMQVDTSRFIELDPAAGDPVEGDMIFRHSGKWELLHIGSDRQVIAVKFGDPSWDDLADVLKAILTTDGDILANISGTVTRIALGSDRQVVAVKFGEPGYHDISDILLSIPLISPTPGTYRALILDGSGVPGFALVNVP